LHICQTIFHHLTTKTEIEVVEEYFLCYSNRQKKKKEQYAMKYYAVRKGHHPRIIAGEWAQVEPEIKKEISGYTRPEWKGFPTRAQAEAYMAETGDKTPQPAAGNRGQTAYTNPEDALAAEFQFSADAVIFVDGSRNFDNIDFDHAKPNRTRNKKKSFYFGSYGIIIFFRDGSVYVENARVDDGDFEKPEQSYFTTTHHCFSMDSQGEFSPVEDYTETHPYKQYQTATAPVEFEDRYVLASWNVVGEVEGAKHALDFCFHKKNCSSAYVFFDCDQIDIIKKIYQGKKPGLASNVTYNYGEFCRGLLAEGKHVGTMHIYSHDKSRKLGIESDWRQELFNSCADVLAKAETYNKPIDAVTENRPLRPYGLTPFGSAVVYTDTLDETEIRQIIDARRRHAFELIKKVLADPKARPDFINEL
jgi:hypothetical protein